jgi:DHA2 family multidrug resistance protein
MAENVSSRQDLARQGFVAIAVLMASILTALDLRMFGIGLADLRGAFGLNSDEGSWLGTFATAPQVLVAPCVGWMIAVFGVRRVLVGPTVVYSTASILIPYCQSFEVLISLHAIRAAMMGMFVGATMMTAFRNLDRRYWIVALAFYVIRIPFSQNLGLYTAGSYAQSIGWQWIYWQGAIVAPIIGMLFWFGAKPVEIDRALLKRGDWGGMMIFGVSLTTLYFGLDQGNRLDWFQSGYVIAMLGAAAFLAGVFLWHESRVANPWAHVSVLLSRNIALGFVAIFCFMTASLGSSLLKPNFLVTVAHLRPEQIGDFSGPCAILLLAGATVTAVALVRIVKQRFALIIGFCCFALSAWLGTQLTSQWSLPEFKLIGILQTFGEEIVFLAAVATLLSNVNPARVIALTAYVQVVRLMCSETVGAIMATWIRQREQLHSYLIGLHVTSPTRGLGSMSLVLGHGSGSSGTQASDAKLGIGLLAGIVQREANVQAYIDGFWCTFLAAILGLLVVSLMTKSPAHPLTTQTLSS